MRQLPGSIQHVMNLEPQIAAWAQKFAKKASALFLGRGIHYPIALEGALKLKENMVFDCIRAELFPERISALSKRAIGKFRPAAEHT